MTPNTPKSRTARAALTLSEWVSFGVLCDMVSKTPAEVSAELHELVRLGIAKEQVFNLGDGRQLGYQLAEFPAGRDGKGGDNA